MFHCTSAVDFQNITTAGIDFLVLNAEDSEACKCSVKNCFCAGIDIKSTSFVMVQSQWVISLDKVEVALIIKHGKYKRTLDKLSHLANGLYVEDFLLLQELNR